MILEVVFEPQFTITPAINRRIVEIERLRTIVDQAVILPELEVTKQIMHKVNEVISETNLSE